MGLDFTRRMECDEKKEDGFNAIVTVALIAVMIAVAAVLIRMMGNVVQPVGTSVEKFLSGRI